MRSYYSLISLLVIIPLLGFETNGHHLPSVHEPIPSPTENRRMAPESLSENLYKSFFDEKVKAYKIDYDSDYIGQSIWISRS
jgi:hypothetical protein